MARSRRRRIGAEIVDGGVDFRVWAPARSKAAVVLDSGERFPLHADGSGYFSATVPRAGAGTRYRFQLDGDADSYPDPASRWQPDGPGGSSAVVDPAAYPWKENGWQTPQLKGAVISEIHIGTFTPAGTFAAAIPRLPLLADAGINIVEVMPVNEFPGRFGWGYDGVDLWAPTRLYGEPDDFRRFVDAAHAAGLAVLLDVVYNHLGPDGCYLTRYTPDYFTKKYRNEWGDAVNFDGPHCEGVREFFTENAAYWIDEFRLDGLRVDATQSFNDDSRRHILVDIVASAREAGRGRGVIVIAENEPQEARLIDAYGFDAIWNDDWHHSASVALTGRNEAYYTDYLGNPQEFVSMARLGFLYQGQHYKWQKKRRGSPSAHLPPERLVCFLQNHDQVANSARGERLDRLTSPGRLRAMTTLLLLQPQTPMLFQGQEFAASAPFLYFADHAKDLAVKVREGRHAFIRQFVSANSQDIRGRLAPPESEETFAACRLDFAERDGHGEVLALHRDLIRLRRSDATISRQRSDILEGAVVGSEAFVLRWLTGGIDDRLLLVNLGRDLHLDPAPQPLLAPPAGATWELMWSSEAAAYGGNGTPPIETEAGWTLPGHAAVLMRAR